MPFFVFGSLAVFGIMMDMDIHIQKKQKAKR